MKTERKINDEAFEETAAEWLRKWDAGKIVWTVEMGGLGPGYEQAIQIGVAELIRDHLDKPLPNTDEDWKKWGDDTIHRIDKAVGGYSGAQVGAAKNLAYKFLRDGPRATARGVEDDRKTMVSNYWPRT